KISAAISILLDASKSIREHVSLAADAGTPERNAKHLSQRVLNSAMELSANLAAAVVLGISSSIHSGMIAFHHPWDYVALSRFADSSPGALLDVHSARDDGLDVDAALRAEESVAACAGAGDSEPSPSDVEEAEHAIGAGLERDDSSVCRTAHACGDAPADGEVCCGSARAPDGPDSRGTRSGVELAVLHEFEESDTTPRFGHARLYQIVSANLPGDEEWLANELGDGGGDFDAEEPEGARTRGRIRERFVLESPHPLRHSHIIARQYMPGVVAYGGAPPPRPLASKSSGRVARVTRAAEATVAAFYLINFKPWSMAKPLVITSAEWERWLSELRVAAGIGVTFVLDPDEVVLQTQARRVAMGRPLSIRNVRDGFRADEAASKACNAFRGPERTLWDDSTRPGVGEERDPSDAEGREASKEIADVLARAESRLNGPTLAVALKQAGLKSSLQDKLRAALPTAGALGQPLSRAAEPQRVVVGATTGGEGLPGPGVAGADEVAVPREFAVLNEKAHEEKARAFAAAPALDAAAPVRPPLNPQQRQAAAAFHRAIAKRESALYVGATLLDAAAGKDSCLLVTGPAGSGKSQLVYSVIDCCRAQGLAPLVVCAFTGVAAAPFGGPTLQRLMGMSQRVPPTRSTPSDATVAAWRVRFRDESGMDVTECEDLIDEISFVTAAQLLEMSIRLQHMLGVLGVPFGGMPILLAGDCYQKDSPQGVSWYHDLVASADGRTAVAEGADALAAAKTTSLELALQLLRAAPRIDLWRIMRCIENEPFASVQRQPVSDAFVAALRPVKAADLRDDDGWRFAPVGVLSHLEHDAINTAQLFAFARAFDLPLVRRRLPLMPNDIPPVLPHQLDELYANEPGLWGYYVQGAPALISENIKATRRCVNGSPGVLHSLTFDFNTVLPHLSAAIDARQFAIVDIDEPPVSVNIQIGACTWHGVSLPGYPDLLDVDEATLPPNVVPLVGATSILTQDLVSIYAAQLGASGKVRVKSHIYLLAFAMTDFKLQGWTLGKLILSLPHRDFMPWMTMTSLYVLVSRVTSLAGLRVMYRDEGVLRNLTTLQLSQDLVGWYRGYDVHGIWSDTCAQAALAEVRERRAALEVEQRRRVYAAKASARKSQRTVREQLKASATGKRPASSPAGGPARKKTTLR
ncbi:hypothetical protein T492DRAFT_885747, partial [Pavlovales sp. CCMP2436]